MKKTLERGQSLIVIALMFLGLIAVGALVVDGGSLYLNRRTAQTAADAAAMAGARELCLGKTDTEINTMVQTFAGNNAATADAPTIDRTLNATTNAHGSVSVHTTVKTASFLAGAIGFKDNAVTADASAGCFTPSTGKNLLPISWACQPPVGGGTPGSTCVTDSLPWSLMKDQILPGYGSQLGEQTGSDPGLVLDNGTGTDLSTYVNNPLHPGKMAYLIMDNSTQVTDICASPYGSGTINCDWDGDHIPNLSGGGDRGWLALDGTGAKTIRDIIVDGFSTAIKLPQWFPAENGAASSVFGDAKGAIEGHVVLVPVYNAFCPNTTSSSLPTDPNCILAGYVNTDEVSNNSSAGNKTFYRIAGFAPFVVTCVSSKPNETCPVKTLAGLVGPLKNTLTIEGYFVSGDFSGTNIDPSGFDLGVYVVSLMK